MPAWGRALIATVALYAVGKIGEGLLVLWRVTGLPVALLVLNANDFA